MQHQSHPYVRVNYGSSIQYVPSFSNSKPLDKEGNKFIMSVTSTFLYCFEVVGETMLTALRAIVSEQSAPI